MLLMRVLISKLFILSVNAVLKSGNISRTSMDGVDPYISPYTIRLTLPNIEYGTYAFSQFITGQGCQQCFAIELQNRAVMKSEYTVSVLENI